MEAKTNLLADVNSVLEEAEANLADTRQELEADTATLEATLEQCRRKAEEWAERSETRSKELANFSKLGDPRLVSPVPENNRGLNNTPARSKVALVFSVVGATGGIGHSIGGAVACIGKFRILDA